MSHEISLAVWDLPSPVVIGGRATLKVGISCPSGCSMSGATIEIRDGDGAMVANGRAGSNPWPGTVALYWSELDVAAPHTEGTHAWSVSAIGPDASHEQPTSVIHFVSSRSPEHRVLFEVIDKGTGAPLGGVELRIGPFRAATDDAGRACVHVPLGTFEVCAWKIGHDLLTMTTHVEGETTLQLSLAVTIPPDQPYWM